jgi:uncharacterized protein (DUF302 family)
MSFMARVLLATFIVLSRPTLAAEGIIEVKSPYGAKETVDRLESFLKSKDMTIFARVDHAAGAVKVGKQLRPTEILVFGNPQGGTPLMECAQTIGIDLPLKALAWQDAPGQVWVGYNDPVYLVRRHGVPQCAVAEKVKATLTGLIEAALAK